MATRTVISCAVPLLLYLWVSCASADVCLPDLWEGEFISVSPFHFVQGTTAIDVKGQRISNLYVKKNHHHDSGKPFSQKEKKTRVIADFKKGTIYIIFLSPDDDKVCGCVKKPIRGPAFAPSCSKDAKLVRNITIGGKLDVNVYKVLMSHGTILVALAEGSNLPVSTVFLFHFLEVETKYYNVHEKIDDTSIFDIPAECESSASLSVMSEDRVMAGQAVLRGRSLLHEESASEGGCPSLEKMLKKARKERTFAGHWNRETGQTQYDEHSEELDEEKVEDAVARYYKEDSDSTHKFEFPNTSDLIAHNYEDDDHANGEEHMFKTWFGHSRHHDDDEHDKEGKLWHMKKHHHHDEDHEKWGWKGHNEEVYKDLRKWASRPVDMLLGAMQ
eukprot:TRINITY_DN21552_c0_g1_i1.p1 TRINITY_DN21552_c0_g1~~TRINITY_DN21552_c0_g1_i1.p1  ORF type:complete len:387 (-),score=75.17 TRINITY_DN21552_c0_g1_i1:618-1778(-)